MTDKTYKELAIEHLEAAKGRNRPRGEWGYIEYDLKMAQVYATLAVAEALGGKE